MNRFNTLLGSHFKGCKLLGEYALAYGNRRGKCYEVPDHPELVGYTDGVHAWVASGRDGAVVRGLLKPGRVLLTDSTSQPVTRERRQLLDQATSPRLPGRATARRQLLEG